MLVEMVCIDLLVNTFESCTSHVLLTNTLNFLDSVVITQQVKLVIDGINQFNKLLSVVLLAYLNKLAELNEDNCSVPLFFSLVLL